MTLDQSNQPQSKLANGSSRPLAAVTGASSGIGFELAKQFATNGFDVIVAAEDLAITTAARELEELGAGAESVQVDLATYDGVEQLYARIRAAGRPLDAIAINAGVGVGGDFVDTPLEDELKLIALNVNHPVHLAKRVVKDMVARGQGRILITSSIAATMPGPHYAIYAASRSFVQSFAEAIRAELAETGVTVTALQPGPTDTEFFDRAGMQETVVNEKAPKDDPAQVAKDGFEALMAGKDSVVAGATMNKLQAVASGILPQPLAAKLHGKQAEPTSDS